MPRVTRTTLQSSIFIVLVGLAMLVADTGNSAECDKAVVQEVLRSGGVWQEAAGTLVTIAVVEAGLAWDVAKGMELSKVQAETTPEQVGDAVISSMIVLLGSPTGVIPTANDSDMKVVFTGVAECGIPGTGS